MTRAADDRGHALTRRSLLQGVGAALALGSLSACGGGSAGDRRSPTSTGRPTGRKPNVIVVFADDMRYDELPYMPAVTRHLVDAGVSFTAARHNISLCSPSRAGFLTGQYSVRHKVRSQHDSFTPANDERDTIAVWMQAAGYDTGLIGKYFTGKNRSAPGWTVRRQLATKPQEARGFTVWDGERESTPGVDQTEYLDREVVSFVERASEPFFLWFTPTADHWPLQAPPGHEADLESLVWPDPREADVGDKPRWIRELPALGEDQLRALRRNQLLRVRELLGLDDTVGAIFKALERRGSLDDTVVMFSSDNGVLDGEHRVPLLSKNLPYEPSVRVPCLVRAPGLAAAVVDAPAQMSVDLTATCVAVAGAAPTLDLDGLSLLEVAARPAAHRDRRLLYDRDDRDDFVGFGCPPASGVFTVDRKLIRYETTPPTYELYDIERDPDELENLAEDPAHAEERRALDAELDALLASVR